MSEPIPVLLAGASGLIGGEIMRRAGGLSLTPLSRSVAPAEQWPALIAKARPQVFINALGTTWKAAGKNEAAFRAVDQELVLRCARAARDAGCGRCITISSVGASAKSGNFYLRVKGEVEDALANLGFARLDILRPGLLRGARGGERRVGERLAIIASPLTDLLMQGGMRRYRSIAATDVARASLALAREGGSGRTIHDHDALIAAARRFAN